KKYYVRQLQVPYLLQTFPADSSYKVTLTEQKFQATDLNFGTVQVNRRKATPAKTGNAPTSKLDSDAEFDAIVRALVRWIPFWASDPAPAAEPAEQVRDRIFHKMATGDKTRDSRLPAPLADLAFTGDLTDNDWLCAAAAAVMWGFAEESRGEGHKETGDSEQ